MGGIDDPDIDPQALARAEAALSQLAENYLSWAQADIAAMRACLDDAATPGGDLADCVWRLFRVAHDMKGQAATFGYPLITEIGHRLCRLIEAAPIPDAGGMTLIRHHVDALAVVVSARLEGDGGSAGRALLASLE